jgi:hypothetical protein
MRMPPDDAGRVVAANGGDAVAWRVCHLAASRFKEPRAPKETLSHADGGPHLTALSPRRALVPCMIDARSLHHRCVRRAGPNGACAER